MQSHSQREMAPELDVIQWINAPTPLSLTELRGKVVVLHAFQMLCPGCVIHGIPQATAIQEAYAPSDLHVIGLHTVFEHHSVMTVDALKAFVHEYRIAFPVAVDRPSTTGSIPHTMQRFRMQGTPTLIILDKAGNIRLNHFGRLSDMQVGSFIGGLLAESEDLLSVDNQKDPQQQCGDEGCLLKTEGIYALPDGWTKLHYPE
jgi:peroxiredoxin